MLDHYFHTAHKAARLLYPHRAPDIPPLAPPSQHTRPEQLADRQAAISWLTAERRVLLAVLGQAAVGDVETNTSAAGQDARHIPLLAGVIPFFRMLTIPSWPRYPNRSARVCLRGLSVRASLPEGC